jgi:Cu/Ag efflux protein CusF
MKWNLMILIATLSTALAAPLQAQTTHLATGVVKSVNHAKGTIKLAHDPVKSLNWPAMTMDFQVRDKASLATLKPEQKIEFEMVEEKKGSYVITRIK